MSKKKEDDNTPDYDPRVEAMQYGTIWTNAMFDPGQPALKISRHGMMNIRIPWAAIIWGALFAIIFGLITILIVIVWLEVGYIGFPIVIFFAVLGALLGANIGLWSPMKKSTGEDLLTYMMIVARQKISMGTSGGKISTTELNSKAIGGEEGRIIKCTQWLGTQPLHNAPPMSAYEENYKSEYHIKPRGAFHVVRSENYHDGLGDRF